MRCIATSTLRSEELGKFAQGKKIDISNILTRLELFFNAKGHLISKCPFGVFKSSKKPTKICPGFLP